MKRNAKKPPGGVVPHRIAQEFWTMMNGRQLRGNTGVTYPAFRSIRFLTPNKTVKGDP